MSIYYSADWHVWNHRLLGGSFDNGVNRRCRETLAVIRKASEFVERRGGALVACGDVFDAPRPSPQVMRALMDAVAPLTGDDERPGLWLLAGNHDRVSSAPGDNALAPLGRVPGVRVIDSPSAHEIGETVVFFAPPSPRGVAFVDHLDEVTRGQQADVLVVHAGVEDGLTPHFLKGSRGAIDVLRLAALAKRLGAREAYAGDWHSHRAWGVDGVRVVQCGALVPTGWDNPGRAYGRVVEGGSARVWSLPGPRFIEAQSAEAAQRALRFEFRSAGLRDINYVRVRVPRAEVAKERVALEQIAEEVGGQVDVRAEVVASVAGGVRERSFASVDAALARVVEATVDEDERAVVLDRVRQFLAKALM